MEMWEEFLLAIAGIGSMMVIIIIATNLVRTDSSPKEINGVKQSVVASIADLIYKCYDENKEKTVSVICYKLSISSTGDISSSDIENELDSSKISKSNVNLVDLGSSGEIVIRFENQTIYVEKVENERIGA